MAADDKPVSGQIQNLAALGSAQIDVAGQVQGEHVFTAIILDN